MMLDSGLGLCLEVNGCVEEIIQVLKTYISVKIYIMLPFYFSLKD